MSAKRLTTTSFSTDTRETIAWWIAAFLLLRKFLQDHRTVRRTLSVIAFVMILGVLLYGPSILYLYLELIFMAVRLVFMMAFMIMQFVAIFWFMARTKDTTVEPGDPKSMDLNQYWGQPELVKIMREWLSILSDRKTFDAMGGKPIRGVLLSGGPGTGKTMLAKCMAGEGNIAFVAVEGSGFRAMFWGVDVLKVMSFCGKAKRLAKKHGACIAYIDEIDSIGQSRGSVMGGAGGQGQASGPMGGMMGGGSGALTRLLYEIDGLGDESAGEKARKKARKFMKLPDEEPGVVLFMGSSNRPDVLDPALLRPGRFDRQIQVDPPDRSGRRDIILGYLKQIKNDLTEQDIDILVQNTGWATPAKIMAAITKDCVRIALFAGRKYVTLADIEQGMMEMAVGLEAPISDLDPMIKKQIAVHEAGHTVAQYYLLPDTKIVRVTTIRTTSALGYMMPVDTIDRYTQPLQNYVRSIMVALAGHVAVEIVFGEPWTGAGGDLRMVRAYLETLLNHGVISFSLLGLGEDDRKRVDRFMQDSMEKVRRLLEQKRQVLDTLTESLLQSGELNSSQIEEIFNRYGGRG